MVRCKHLFAVPALLAGFGLAACGPAGRDTPAPVAGPVAQTPVAAPVPSPASQAARQHYAKVQANLLARGLMRTDSGSTDAPFTDRMLADNFVRIALYDEYIRSDRGLVAQPVQSRLRRWDQPVRVSVRFGDSVPADRQATDRARIASFLGRLQAISGHPIYLSEAQPNFFIYIVSEDERQALGPTIRALLPGLGTADVAGITQMPRATYCLVYALSGGTGSAYTKAFAVIRAEHPDLMRLSCLHEEITQGLGLANDSPLARPSIFNDDEEFALLTPMDELMLKMLYDPRLTPGMTEVEARPIVDSLATALIGGDS
ncbi:MAG: DUF2927 domain-containing protein [Rhodobacter sp.]|nr:DUF2927 domain-containing protein [Rhodobacter sp.]MCA3513517.1 DUF2927 domain-containing protein [Rhodobacter sp.]MCA3519507.1 DUF2927 domain-containing protein [Rhodobacter sp.]MCA3524242.1 DUF2927 domain-containing protein [Rhodobacter sp.]MCA3526397.1 DUF2927 domain-containing protein [Rhodobacter sp.]